MPLIASHPIGLAPGKEVGMTILHTDSALLGRWNSSNMPKERQSAEASKIVKRLPATECRRYALSSNFPLPQISHPFLLAFRLIPPHRTESTQWFLFVHPTSRFNDFKIQKPNNKHRASSYPFLLNTSTSAVTETARQRSVSSPHLIFTSSRCSTLPPG